MAYGKERLTSLYRIVDEIFEKCVLIAIAKDQERQTAGF
jgi:hypothetical protein